MMDDLPRGELFFRVTRQDLDPSVGNMLTYIRLTSDPLMFEDRGSKRLVCLTCTRLNPSPSLLVNPRIFG
jgi:hypothetical protein